jgi:hypothetical protein
MTETGAISPSAAQEKRSMIFHHGSTSYAHEVESSLKILITDYGYLEARISVERLGKLRVRMGKKINMLPDRENFPSRQLVICYEGLRLIKQQKGNN